MVTIRPVRRALIPVDSKAAQQIMGPNYDEFQSDLEIWEVIQGNPQSVLRLTMAHCDVPSPESMIEEGSQRALDRAARNLKELAESTLTRVVQSMLWVYEIVDNRRPGIRQLGLGCAAATSEIRTEHSPDGVVIRNEGIREAKARGRADLIARTGAYIGTVNNAVQDLDGAVGAALEKYADSRPADYEATDEHDHVHRVWLVTDAEEVQAFVELMAQVPFAYVADGNHRSAAAALLGRDEYLAVFFTTDRMGLAPYNRLVKLDDSAPRDWLQRLQTHFDVEELGASPAFQPRDVHQIGLYTDGTWYRLVPHTDAFDRQNAVQTIDADIVQNRIFDEIFGISDPRDPRLTFVGGNKEARYLKARVDDGAFDLAITLAPVTMEQFVAVCEQNRFMPPKSTWFDPKIRSGLVIALLD